ncbi:MAG: Yip1 family protein [Bacillota bacterium]|nr:Yip1 family protein [Bacillota bacterium]
MWEYITGALAAPVQTFRETAQKKWWRQGLLLVGGLALLRGLVGAATARANPPLPPGLETTPEFPRFLEAALNLLQSPLFMLIGSLLGGVLVWFLGGVIFFAIGKLFKGQGTLGGVLAGLGFAETPRLIEIPLTAVLSLLGAPGTILGGVASFGFRIWVLVLDVLAVRESLRLGTGAATAVVLIPIALVFIGLFLLGIILAVTAIFTTAPYSF